jgi:hypothetical protein
VINQLFTFSSTIERLRQGPLSEHLDAYAAAVADQGYTRHSIRQQIVVIADFSRWLKQKHIDVQVLDNKVVDRFLRHRHRPQRVRRGDPKTLQRLLAMLGQIGVVKPTQPTGRGHRAIQDRRRVSALPVAGTWSVPLRSKDVRWQAEPRHLVAARQARRTRRRSGGAELGRY